MRDFIKVGDTYVNLAHVTHARQGIDPDGVPHVVLHFAVGRDEYGPQATDHLRLSHRDAEAVLRHLQPVCAVVLPEDAPALGY